MVYSKSTALLLLVVATFAAMDVTADVSSRLRGNRNPSERVLQDDETTRRNRRRERRQRRRERRQRRQQKKKNASAQEDSFQVAALDPEDEAYDEDSFLVSQLDPNDMDFHQEDTVALNDSPSDRDPLKEVNQEAPKDTKPQVDPVVAVNQEAPNEVGAPNSSKPEVDPIVAINEEAPPSVFVEPEQSPLNITYGLVWEDEDAFAEAASEDPVYTRPGYEEPISEDDSEYDYFFNVTVQDIEEAGLDADETVIAFREDVQEAGIDVRINRSFLPQKKNVLPKAQKDPKKDEDQKAPKKDSDKKNRGAPKGLGTKVPVQELPNSDDNNDSKSSAPKKEKQKEEKPNKDKNPPTPKKDKITKTPAPRTPKKPKKGSDKVGRKPDRPILDPEVTPETEGCGGRKKRKQKSTKKGAKKSKDRGAKEAPADELSEEGQTTGERRKLKKAKSPKIRVAKIDDDEECEDQPETPKEEEEEESPPRNDPISEEETPDVDNLPNVDDEDEPITTIAPTEWLSLDNSALGTIQSSESTSQETGPDEEAPKADAPTESPSGLPSQETTVAIETGPDPDDEPPQTDSPTASPSALPSQEIKTGTDPEEDPPKTIAPTEVTTIPTTRAGVTEPPVVVGCPGDVKLVRQKGTSTVALNDPILDAVNIIKQETTTVTVSLKQVWSKVEVIDSIFYNFNAPGASFWGSTKCYEEINIEENEVFDTIDLACNVLKPVAELEICVVDRVEHGTFHPPPSPEYEYPTSLVPRCCYPEDDPTRNQTTVCYTLMVRCTPDNCAA